MHKVLDVYFYGESVGVLRFENHHYEFEYLESYLLSGSVRPISLSLPVTSRTYISRELFPFFKGLLTEGWLKSIQEETQHLDRNDLFSFLVNNGKDLVGAVQLLEREDI